MSITETQPTEESRPVRLDKRQRRTRKALRDALLTLLQQHRFSEIHVSALVAQADVSRQTFYLHYSDLDELLLDWLGDLFASYYTGFMSLLESGQHSEQELVTLLLQLMDQHKVPLRGLLHASIEGLLMQQFVAFTQQVDQALRRRTGAVLEPALAAAADNFLAGGSYMLYRQCLQDPDADYQQYGQWLIRLSRSATEIARPDSLLTGEQP